MLMPYTEQNTLVDFFDADFTTESLQTFFGRLINNEDTFASGEFPTEQELSFIYEGVDIGHLLVDAVAFGIFWEQNTPTEYREQPITPYFTQANSLTSADAVIEAQPHLQVANFFKYITVDITDCTTPGFTPPPVVYQNVTITDMLRSAVLFGAQWEIWNADNLEDRLNTSLNV